MLGGDGDGQNLQLQEPNEGILDALKLINGQTPQPTLQSHQGDRLNLLQMKHTWLQKTFGYGQFPSIPTNRGSMRNHNYQREFVVRGMVAE
jgi:hypothetical protein